MRSVSALTIDWVQPELFSEEWEFFQHPAKQPFYRQHGITWEALTAAFLAAVLSRTRAVVTSAAFRWPFPSPI